MFPYFKWTCGKCNKVIQHTELWKNGPTIAHGPITYWTREQDGHRFEDGCGPVSRNL